jgi:hypothetical protein
MKRLGAAFLFLRLGFLCLTVTSVAIAQDSSLITPARVGDSLPVVGVPIGVFPLADPGSGIQSLPVSSALPLADRASQALASATTLPRMAPELALQAYERRAAAQSSELVSYSASTLIHVELPDTSQYGDYELQRHYAAPRTLEFKPVRFTGDGFVKSNVITRLLQSEVDHVQKDDTSLTAITAANYKFSYKGTLQTPNRLMHVYQVKPRKKRMGLFKGHIYLDAYTGALVRLEGRAIKSPSLFIKQIEFNQDYADVGAFTFPVHIRSEVSTRIVGRAIVDIYQSDYRPVASTTQTAQTPKI